MQRILQSAEPFPLTAIAQNATAASGASASVIVIGAGLGGLSAAIHLRLAGFDVTVYEANDKVGGRANVIEKQGFRFDTGPSLLNYPWVFQELFAAAGKKLEDYVELLPVDPAVAFQWEDGTHLQLSSNFTKLAEECERLEAGGSVALLSFLQDAGAKYRLAFEKLINRNQDNPLKWLSALSPGELRRLSIWRSLDRELRRFFKSRYLREALGAYGMYLGGSPFDLPGLFTILSYGELAYGLWLPKGGIYGIVEEIARLARELGVKIYTNHPIRQIIVNNSKVTGVLLDNGQIQPTSIVVSNVDWPTTNTKLLAPSYQSKVLRQRVNNYRLTPGVITYYWGVSGKVENIGHHAIILPAE
ncbi:MAG: phytoene desaturase family protein [Blastocatellia bacterium]